MKNGFTLIELLVVIAIIGLLSSIIMVSIEGARKKALDTRRIQDIKEIHTALELFFDDHGRYPDSNDGISDTWYKLGTGTTLDNLLVGGGYISEVPSDPVSEGNYYYFYDPIHYCDIDGDGSSDNPAVLVVRLFSESDSKLSNSGDACGNLRATWNSYFITFPNKYTN